LALALRPRERSRATECIEDDGHVAEDGVDNLSVSTPLADVCETHSMTASVRRTVACVALVSALLQPGGSARQLSPGGIDVDLFVSVAALDDREAEAAFAQIADAWKNGYTALFIDVLDLMSRTNLGTPSAWRRISRLARFLEDRTGQRFGTDVTRWRAWVWSLPYDPHPEYGTFKGRLYGQLDRRFEEFFRAPVRSSIRLDEVEWGGVAVNGIPPLEYPRHVTASEAGYLEDANIVFGVYVDGIARAYPKRILAWHELARDRFGTRELTVVYCTLCGTVIPYDSYVGGSARVFGTSGLLYRSNKLMFDAETKSLWSSLDGTPVIGPLVGSGLRLSTMPVVTTTWAEWKRAHPDTTALSLHTGFTRDYSEGAAYRQYFATDDLMFRVSRTDTRLANKAEVLVLRLASPTGVPEPVAIAADFLRRNRVYHVDTAGQHLVVVTTEAGANRVYQAGSHRFSRTELDGRVVDTAGRAWVAGEDELRATFDATLRLPRVPAHRAFWFGWYAQHPETVLIK
jgi:hypothetical protein